MASAVSSYLSKSKKDFKPKAPARRTAVAGSPQSSVHGSIERQLDFHSHTRQNPAAQSVVPTSIPGFTKTTSTSSTDRQELTGSDALRQPSDGAAVTLQHSSTQNATPGPEVVPAPANTTAIVPDTETLNQEDLYSEHAIAISLPRTRHVLQQYERPESLVPSLGTTSSQLLGKEPIVKPPPPDPATGDKVVSTHESEEPLVQPAAKRRKINTPEKVTKPPNTPSKPTQLLQPNRSEEEGSIDPPITADGGAITQVVKPRKTRQTAKTKGKRRTEDLVAAIVADATRGDGEKGDQGRKRQKRNKGPRKRAQTPENAESVRIEPGVITMADLCRDNRTGRKSKRETALQARDAEVLSARKEDAQQPSEEVGNPSEVITQQPPKNADIDAGAGDSHRSQLRALVPSVRIVNGQLVHDESSRTIDRVALANEARGNDEAVVIVDSLSHKVNSGTYMKRERKSKWNEAMTDQFYDGLRMFGTDFSMICKMFPGKSRRAVKLKFSKEEKFYPDRIKSTLLGERIPVDMEEFSKLSNTVYKDPRELDKDMAEDRKRLEEEQAKEKEAMEEAVRERAEEAAAEAAAESAGGGEDSSAKENNAQNGDTDPKRKMGGKRTKKIGRPPSKRPPSNKAQARKEARAVARVVARVLRPAPPT
ncbi:Transcription factor TFIIIB component B [Xylographa trunciseda]|nr:Transcription factor TFIIIB component B [Xylographa trunciseda]